MARLASSSAANAAPPMMCGSTPLRRSSLLQVAHRLLAGADHHVVHREHLRPPPIRAEADVQTVVGDPLVVHPGELVDTLRLQRRAVHPSTGLAQPLALRALGALQQVHLAGRRRGQGSGQGSAGLLRIDDPPLGLPFSEALGFMRRRPAR